MERGEGVEEARREGDQVGLGQAEYSKCSALKCTAEQQDRPSFSPHANLGGGWPPKLS